MEWILSGDYYVNTETGECETKEQYESAVAFLSSEVEINYEEIAGDNQVASSGDSYSTALISNSRKRAVGGGRKPVEIHNPYYSALQGYHSYEDLPQWLEDVIYGSGNNHSGNTRISGKLLFHVLRSMTTLSTALIRNHLNSKRSITTGDTVSIRYSQDILESVRSAIGAIEHQLLIGKDFYTPEYDDFDFDLDAWNYEHHTYIEQSEEQLIEKLKQAGLNDNQIKNYLEGKLIDSDVEESHITTALIRTVKDAHSGMVEIIKTHPKLFKEAFDSLSSVGTYQINNTIYKVAA